MPKASSAAWGSGLRAVAPTVPHVCLSTHTQLGPTVSGPTSCTPRPTYGFWKAEPGVTHREYLVRVLSFPDRETETQMVCEVFTMQAGDRSLAQGLKASESEVGGEKEEGTSVPHTAGSRQDSPQSPHRHRYRQLPGSRVAASPQQATTRVLQVQISRLIESK